MLCILGLNLLKRSVYDYNKLESIYQTEKQVDNSELTVIKVFLFSC